MLLVKVLEATDARRKNERLMRRAPYVAIARDGLTDQVGEDVVREVAVVLSEYAGIPFRKEMKGKPVICLAQKLRGHGSRLLSSQTRNRIRRPYPGETGTDQVSEARRKRSDCQVSALTTSSRGAIAVG